MGLIERLPHYPETGFVDLEGGLMFLSSVNIKVYLAMGNTDMRKSINGLSILVSENLELDPFSGHLFAFCNKKRNMLKILYWDRNGFCLWHKRLEKRKYGVKP